MTTEMPWVIETRLAPGQKRKRNPTWGILAACLGLLNALLFVIDFALLFVAQELFFVVLPIFGVVTLAALGCCIAAIAKRGTFNVTMGSIALGVVVLTNPLIPLLFVSLLAA